MKARRNHGTGVMDAPDDMKMHRNHEIGVVK